VARTVETESGRRLGRSHDLRGELRGSHLVVTGICVGTGGLFERLGIDRGPRGRVVPWDAVVRLEGDRIVVRDGTETQ
jgi:hypothetical protein